MNRLSEDEEAALSALAAEVNAAIPKMHASLDHSIATLEGLHEEMGLVPAGKGCPPVSAFGEAFAALKSVILIQNKLERIEKEISSTAADLRGLKDYAVEIDKGGPDRRRDGGGGARVRQGAAQAFEKLRAVHGLPHLA